MEFTQRLLLHVRINQLSDNGSLLLLCLVLIIISGILSLVLVLSLQETKLEKILNYKRFQIGNHREKIGKKETRKDISLWYEKCQCLNVSNQWLAIISRGSKEINLMYHRADLG